MNSVFTPKTLSEYYMDFSLKADYSGPYDSNGIPLLNYHGSIGLQYNPIAIAQFGLGNFNLFRLTGNLIHRKRALDAAHWLVSNLQQNAYGFDVWNHHFDWEYRTRLKAPWYSGLAQGQAISLLLRAYVLTSTDSYMLAACRAFKVLTIPISEGGVLSRRQQDVWLEEYIVDPPTHILNGCIWALWGVYDFALLTGDSLAWDVFSAVSETIARNLSKYDTGYWSLYEQSGLPMEMLASFFYHALHIVQLRVLHRFTGNNVFRDYAERWERNRANKLNCAKAFIRKTIFKLTYY